jgi:Tfp pilus assembly PilM family ATPase
MRVLPIPVGTECEERSAVIREMEGIVGRGFASYGFDYWPVDASPVPRSDQLRDSVILSVSNEFLELIAADSRKSRLYVRVLDGLPFALARVMDMSPACRSQGCSVAIDWGFSTATFCAIRDSVPVLVRRLPDCGFGRVIGALSAALGVSFDEAQHLLTRHGVPQPSAKHAGIQTVIRRATVEALDAFADELKRTLLFLGSREDTSLPDQLWLFGGGATIGNISECLSEKVGAAVQVWRAFEESAESDSERSCPIELLGPAIGLSSLAWGWR